MSLNAQAVKADAFYTGEMLDLPMYKMMKEPQLRGQGLWTRIDSNASATEQQEESSYNLRSRTKTPQNEQLDAALIARQETMDENMARQVIMTGLRKGELVKLTGKTAREMWEILMGLDGGQSLRNQLHLRTELLKIKHKAGSPVGDFLEARKLAYGKYTFAGGQMSESEFFQETIKKVRVGSSSSLAYHRDKLITALENNAAGVTWIEIVQSLQIAEKEDKEDKDDSSDSDESDPAQPAPRTKSKVEQAMVTHQHLAAMERRMVALITSNRGRPGGYRGGRGGRGAARDHGGGRGRGQRFDRKCWHCGEAGHLQRDCEVTPRELRERSQGKAMATRGRSEPADDHKNSDHLDDSDY